MPANRNKISSIVLAAFSHFMSTFIFSALLLLLQKKVQMNIATIDERNLHMKRIESLSEQISNENLGHPTVRSSEVFFTDEVNVRNRWVSIGEGVNLKDRSVSQIITLIDLSEKILNFVIDAHFR